MKKDSKKIVIDARMMGAHNAGIGRSIEELVKGLIDFSDSDNIEYYLFLTNKNFDFGKNLSPNWHKVLVDVRWYTLKEQWLVLKELKKIKPDLAYFPHFNVPLFYFGKFVVTIHDLIWLKYPRPRKEISTLGPVLYWFKNFLSKIIFYKAVNGSEKVTVPTEFTKKEVIEYFNIKPAKVEVIYWGAWLKKIQKKQKCKKEDLSEASCLSEIHICKSGSLAPQSYVQTDHTETDNLLKKCYNINKPYLLYVGSAYPHKNLEFLVDIFSDNSIIELGIQLVLVGKDDYFYQNLKRLVQGMNLDDRIIFTGYVDDEELVLLYRKALAFIFPTLIEGFGFPPLEAIINAVPVIVSKESCLPEVIGDAGLYFDPRDKKDLKNKILEIVKDGNVRDSLIEKGFVQVKKYDWESCISRYKDIFFRILY